ncbi:MAG: cytochrome c3 family protein, partial [bacterium]
MMQVVFKISVFVCCIFLFSSTVPASAQQQEKIGDILDGNRSIPVHLIEMFDADEGPIRPGDQPLMPFSTKQTCLPCHDYSRISGGWHFNAAEKDVHPGRSGEPWIWVDPMTATQIPISYSNWPGTIRPERLGMTSWDFILQFGRHTTGGGTGELGESDPPDLLRRWMISGDLEINCMSCHDGDAAHDQAEYAAQVLRQNFRWAAAASSGFTRVYGSAKDMPDNFDLYAGGVGDHPDQIPPTVQYMDGTFDARGKVFFNITKKIPNERCYFCHSTNIIGGDNSEKWEFDEDVHLKSGLMCVDCHRNGINHDMIRGYEEEAEITGNRTASSFTCQGCHLHKTASASPDAGRLGAPWPKHTGIPVVHFDKLSCTACHSGPQPSGTTFDLRTSRAHALGMQNTPKSPDAVPHIVGPVYAKQENGKIAPHKLFFPSCWVTVDGDSVAPISPDVMRPIVFQIISQDTLTDSTNFALIGQWN